LKRCVKITLAGAGISGESRVAGTLAVAEDTSVIANSATSNSGVIRRTKEFYPVNRVSRLSHCQKNLLICETPNCSFPSKSVEKLLGGLSQSRVAEIGSDLCKRFKDEPAPMHGRMRNGQVAFREHR
jgi:hypothetical protein